MSNNPLVIRKIPHEARHVAVSRDGSRIAVAGADGQFSVVDRRLQVLAEGRLPVAAGPVALHPSANVLAVDSETETALVGFSGEILGRLGHRPWSQQESGDLDFLPDGNRLLAIRASEGGGASLVLVRADTLEALDEYPIEIDEEAGYSLLPSPRPDTWVLWAGAGQDGQWSFRVRLQGDRIEVVELDDLPPVEHRPVCFSSTGEEILFDVEGGLNRYRFRDMRLLSRTEPPAGFYLDMSTCLLDPTHALVMGLESSRLYSVLLADGAWDATEFPLQDVDRTVHGDPWFFRALPAFSVLFVFGTPGRGQTLVRLGGLPSHA